MPTAVANQGGKAEVGVGLSQSVLSYPSVTAHTILSIFEAIAHGAHVEHHPRP